MDLISGCCAGIVAYNVSHVANDEVKFKVNLFDKDDELAAVQESSVGSGTLEVPKANFWWPYLMDPNPGYLYTLRVSICDIIVYSYATGKSRNIFLEQVLTHCPASQRLVASM